VGDLLGEIKQAIWSRFFVFEQTGFASVRNSAQPPFGSALCTRGPACAQRRGPWGPATQPARALAGGLPRDPPPTDSGGENPLQTTRDPARAVLNDPPTYGPEKRAAKK